jgi:catechol 2,3-dioxygenase-like lactoylglutathione lyase family enzyme
VTAAWQLQRIALNVADLAAATRFYVEALGFALDVAETADPALARLLGVRALRWVRLRRGAQILELSACDPPGAPMPPDGRSNDAWFQHCALVTSDMASDYQLLLRFRFTPISRGGPQTLPGGIVAFKFRDPDGHPLELITFPRPDPATLGGIDHSAICVADATRSIDFYADRLGLRVAARQVNTGQAQDALDDLEDALVDVVALECPRPGPHLELLGYRHPIGRAGRLHPGDIGASRLVFCSGADGDAALLHDPDGHAVLLLNGVL